MARDSTLLCAAWRCPATGAVCAVDGGVVCLGLGDAKSLAPVASAVLWLAVLLAGLLALDHLFRSDAEDGSLEQWMLAPVPLWWLILVRTVMHWLTTALPVIVAVPLLGELLHLPHTQLPVCWRPCCWVHPFQPAGSGSGCPYRGHAACRHPGGAAGTAAVCAGPGIPGAGAVAAHAQGMDASGALLLLGAGLVLSLVLAPHTAAAALRLHINDTP